GTGLGHEYFSIDKDVEMIKHLGDDLFLVKAKGKKSKEDKEKDKENSYFKEIDKLPFYLNGLGFIKDEDSALYFYDASKDRLELIKNLKAEDKLSFVDINEDSSKILLLRGNYTDNSVMKLKEDLLLLDTKSGEITLLIENKFSYYTARFIKDRIIFVATDMEKGGVNEDCFIYSADFEGKYEKISPDDFDMAFGNSIGTD